MSSTSVAGWQSTMSWHHGGMYMGMHWVWWSIWVLTVAFLRWAFWRLKADRSETHHRVERREAAEEALRRRFAAVEIDEEEFTRRMRVLRETPLNVG